MCRCSSATATTIYRQIYLELGRPEGDLWKLREFYCPDSGRLLETKAVWPACPVMHEHLPDIEGFYKGWSGRNLPYGCRLDLGRAWSAQQASGEDDARGLSVVAGLCERLG
jgi:hypothetical protein